MFITIDFSERKLWYLIFSFLRGTSAFFQEDSWYGLYGISGICSLINSLRDDVTSVDNHGFGIVPKLESLETNKTNITNRISSEPGAGAEQSFLCPGKLMIKDGGMIQCDHLLLTKKGKWTIEHENVRPDKNPISTNFKLWTYAWLHSGGQSGIIPSWLWRPALIDGPDMGSALFFQ